ncbi:MAG: 4Fe-4S dicluster domain-containing protein [Tissierellia bacterium]|nr:4Fe-4S dicluster domain-containing protein [Tissierellia bacterium]
MKENRVPKAKGYITMTDPKIAACQDCKVCELFCSLTHDGSCGAELNRIWESSDIFAGEYFTYSCKQCISPSCLDACPTGAIYVDEKTGARCINEKICIGCMSCIRACPLDPPRINFDSINKKAKKCDLCKDREEGPACVQMCPTMCLQLKKY